MNIVILGFGNIGHQTAVLSAVAKNNVSVFCSQRLSGMGVADDDFSKEIKILNENLNIAHSAKILFSGNAKKILADADLIFITRPSFLADGTAKFLENNLLKPLQKPLKICLMPGNNGAEFAYRNLTKNLGVELFALQRVPSVARIVQNLDSVQCSGYRKQLQIANLQSQKFNVAENQKIMENIFQMETAILPHFLNVSLTPGNNILHTSRLFCLFKDFVASKSYAKLPLFYENWDDQSSQMLLQMDDELAAISAKLNLQILPLRQHYADLTENNRIQTPQQLTHKLQSIRSLQGLRTPSKKVAENKLLPDFSSRYFCDDFAFGLKFLLQTAKLLNVDFQTSERVFAWYKNLNLQQSEFDFSNYQINSLQDFFDYYK